MSRTNIPPTTREMQTVVDRVDNQRNVGHKVKDACKMVGVSDVSYYGYRKKLAATEHKPKPASVATPTAVVYPPDVTEAINNAVNLFINHLDQQFEQAMKEAVEKLGGRYNRD